MRHVLDNGICITCQHEHDLVDGRCETCSDARHMSESERALATALDELSVMRAETARAFDPTKHPRNPKGAPGGGRFRSLVDRLKDAIEEHRRSGRQGHPFQGFDREQLRRVARDRGIPLKRGEDRDSIAQKLLDHLNAGTADTPAAVHPRKPPRPKPEPSLHTPPALPARGKDISADVDYKTLPTTYNAATGQNDALKAIIARQGFDGPPKVVSGKDFDAAAAAGDVRETWRGLSPPARGPSPAAMAEQYRTGDFYVGLGINGDGTYVAIGKTDAQTYGSTLLRIGLRKDAKVISADALDVEMDRFFDGLDRRRKSAELRRLDEKLLKDLGAAKTARARANIRRKYRDAVFGLDSDRSIALQRDPGIFAALRGYDAIEIPKDRSPDRHHEMIILNRSATIVQEA